MNEITYTAKCVDFKQKMSSGRIIKDIERRYTLKKNQDATSKKEQYTLNQILSIYAGDCGCEETVLVENDSQDVYERYREHYINSRISTRKIPLGMILQMIVYTFAIIAWIFVFLKFFTFEIFDSVDVKYRIPIYIVSLLLGLSALYFWKYHPQIMATLFGDDHWIDVIEFYDNPKRYYRRIGSKRANRLTEVENQEVYLIASLNGRKMDLVIEKRIYRNVCDLKRIPVRIYKDKVFVNEIAVNISTIKWGKKQ